MAKQKLTDEQVQSKRLKAVAERRHPEHQKMAVEWAFLRQSVEGGPDYHVGNLFKHPKEDPKIYANRLERAADNHFNVSQLVCDTYEGYILQTPPTVETDTDEVYLRFIEKADQEGRPAVAFAREVLHWVGTYGVIWVAVDKPAKPDDVVSAAQELEAGCLPYAYVVHPTHVLDGKVTRGKADWLLIQEDVRDDENPWISSGKIVTKWRLWEKDRWTLITKHKDKQGREWYTSQEGVNELGEVPFVPFYFGETVSGFSSKGLLSDIAHLDRAIFNKTSLLDEIHYAATFPQLAIPFIGDLIGVDGHLSPEGRMILTMGLHSVLPFHAEAGKPEYVAPPSGPADTLESNIQKMIQMALSLALLDGEIAKDGHTKTASSGVSKAYVFEKLNRRLSEIADMIELGFNRIFEMVAKWQGHQHDPAKVILSFSRNFEVRSLAQEIADSISLLSSGIPSDKFKKALFKMLVRKAFPKMPADKLAEIEAEIDAANLDEYMMQGIGGEEEENETDEMKDDLMEPAAPHGNGNRIAKKGE